MDTGNTIYTQEQLDNSLIAIVKSDFPDFTKKLIELGTNLNYKNSAGMTPIWSAILKNKISQVKVLIDNGADLNVEYDGKSLLSYACDNKHDEIIDLLLGKINQSTMNDQLISIVQTDYVKCTQKLIELGANVNYKNSNNMTPIWTAMSKNKISQVEFLIKNGADVNVEYNKTALLHQAYLNSYLDIFKLLIKYANVNCRSVTNSLLGSACYNNRIEFVKLLLDNSADPNFADIDDGYKDSPLINACYSTNTIEIIKLLLEQPTININYRNKQGKTALDLAKGRRSHEIIELLENYKKSSGTFVNKDNVKFPKLVSEKKLKIEAISDKTPTPELIIIPENTILTFSKWDDLLKEWIAGQSNNNPNKIIIEITNDKIGYHNYPGVGYVKFNELTMLDGKIKKLDELYYE
jgi:ankyrin repeat protein